MDTTTVAAERDAARTVAEDQGPDVAASAPVNANYRNRFGRFTKPQAPAFVAYEEGLMSAQMEEERRHPTRPVKFALASPATFLFRSDPGHRVVALRIPGVPQCRNEKHQEYHQRKYEAKYGPAARKRHARLAELVGGLTLTFTPIARKQECYYETDETVIATYLREEIEAGRLPHVYEDAPAKATEEETLPTHRAQAAIRLRLLDQEREIAAATTGGGGQADG